MGTPNEEDDHINPQIMAYSAIGVMIFFKFFSTAAIYAKDGDEKRALMQFFDVLIFYEIYKAHKKITNQIEHRIIGDKKKIIDSTLSFKYVRQMEAVFESIPESILQLIYVMRTSNIINPIFIISISLSIISMTLSILNHDGIRMQDEKWEKYKKKFPPSRQFAQHAVIRFSEVSYRIGLLSLLWTVCRGDVFFIILILEFLWIIIRTITIVCKGISFDADTIILALSSLIIVPSEDMFASKAEFGFATGTGIFCLVCGGWIPLIPVFCSLKLAKDKHISFGHIIIPTLRIIVSFFELLFIIEWACDVFAPLIGEKHRFEFLFSPDHGLYIFIITCFLFFVYTQFPLFFPKLSLPLNVNVRSKWGYAYSNELGEMENMNVRSWRMKEDEFWNQSYRNNILAVPYVFAMANKNYEICDWLVKKKNVPDVELTPDIAQKILQKKWKWADVFVPMISFIESDCSSEEILFALQLCVEMINNEKSVEEFIYSMFGIKELKEKVLNPFTYDETIQIVSALELKKKDIRNQCHTVLSRRFFYSLKDFLHKRKRKPIGFLKKVIQKEITEEKFIVEITNIERFRNEKYIMFSFLDDNDRSEVIEALLFRKEEFRKSCSKILKPYKSL